MPQSPRLLRPARNFTPKSIAGLALWLDASDSSTLFQDAAATTPATATSDPVGAWLDKSGNARHATQSTAASRPTISANTQGGKKMLGFDGANGRLTISFPVTAADPVSMIAVARRGATNWGGGGGGGYGSFLNSTGGSSGGPQLRVDTGNIEVIGGTNKSTTLGSNVGVGSCAIIEGMVSSVATSLYVQGALVDSDAGAGAITTAGTRTSIGAWNDGTQGGGPLNGDIAELICYRASLSTSQRQKLERYLAAKWGITLAPQVSSADAQDWINRVYANGGTVSSSTAAAVNTLCIDLENALLRDRFYRLNLFCGTGLNAALVPLYRGPSLGGTQYGNTTDTNAGGLFVSGDYSESLGLLGGGSRWLDTGFKPQTAGIAAASVHLSAVWPTFTHPVSTNVFPLSMVNASVTERHWLNVNSNTTPTTEITASAGGNGATGSIVDTLYATNGGVVVGGLRTVSRTTSSVARLFLGATQRAVNNDTMFNTVSTENLSVFARWNGTTTFGHFAQRMMSYSVGLGMDSTQVAAFNTAITNFNAAMGRSV